MVFCIYGNDLGERSRGGPRRRERGRAASEHVLVIFRGHSECAGQREGILYGRLRPKRWGVTGLRKKNEKIITLSNYTQ